MAESFAPGRGEDARLFQSPPLPRKITSTDYILIGLIAGVIGVSLALLTERDFPGLFDECYYQDESLCTLTGEAKAGR